MVTKLPEKWSFGPLRFRRFYGSNANGDWTPYLSKMTLRIGRWSIGVHKFHRGDADPDCHDHPFDFWTLPLTTYVEEVLDWQGLAHGGTHLYPSYTKRLNVVKAFRVHYRPASYAHRVLYRKGYPPIAKRCIWTIVLKRSIEREWGFLKQRDGRWCWQAWDDYINQGGKDVGCNE